MTDRVDLRDGLWHSSDPYQTVRTNRVWSEQAGRGVDRHLRVWVGRIFRHLGSGLKPEEDRCPDYHFHRTRKGARECAQKAANRLNRELARRPE